MYRRYISLRLVACLLSCLLYPPILSAATLNMTHDRLALGNFFEYLEDPGGSLTIGQVRNEINSERFQVLNKGEIPNLGYSHSVFWIRVHISTSERIQTNWMLEVPFPSLDSIEVFLIDNIDGSIIDTYASGDVRPFEERPYRHRNYVFPFTIPRAREVTLFMRVESRGSLTLPAVLWRSEAFEARSRVEYMAIMLYFGILAALFAYNLMLYFTLRDRVYLFYVLFVAGMAWGQGSWNGLFFEYLWPNYPDFGNVSAILGFSFCGLFGTIFSREFLRSWRYSPRVDKGLLLCILLFAALLPGTYMLSYRTLAIATSISGISFSVLAVLAAWFSWRGGLLSARYFLLAWAVLLIGAVALGARNLGLLPSNAFTLYAMQIGSALEVLLLSFALADRISELRRMKRHAEVDAARARNETVDTLRQAERELESRVRERTRELEHLTQELREQESELKSFALHDPLTGLANRRLFDERLKQACARAHIEGQRIALFVIDLDNFKQVNDMYGHEAGDRLLVAVAERLQLSLRGNDTVARMGGDEFFVIADGLKDPRDAERIGCKLLASLCPEVQVDGHGVRPDASIGIGIYPEDGVNPRDVIKHTDQAMYRAKHSQREKIFLTPALRQLLDPDPEPSAS